MAFEGYLLKFGKRYTSDSIHKYIEIGSYKASEKVQDLDAYRNANGVLVRNALEHTSFVVEFTTRPGLSSVELEEIFSLIRDSYSVPTERKLVLKAFVPEKNDYLERDVYMPDPNITVKRIKGNEVYYDKVSFKFIAY